MCVVSINVPEEILLDLHEDKNDFAEYIKKCWHWIYTKINAFLLDIVPILQK